MTGTTPKQAVSQLSDSEGKLVSASREGVEFLCSTLAIAEIIDSDDQDVQVRAEVIRELLLKRCGTLDPRGIQITGAKIIGVLNLNNVTSSVGIRLKDCVVEGLSMRGASFPWVNFSGSSIGYLEADQLHVDGPLDLIGISCINVDREDVIELRGASIGGSLYLNDAAVCNKSGPALSADGMAVGANLSLKGAKMEGKDAVGVVRLHRVRVAGQLDLEVGKLANSSGLLINLQSADVKGPVFFPAQIICANVDGRSCRNVPKVHLQDFKFHALALSTWKQWLHIIRFHTKEYRPSPYQNLAAFERAAGHDGNVRKILIVQQSDLRKRAGNSMGGWLTRRFHWLWGILAGYGYRTRYTLIALAFALMCAGFLGWWAGQVSSKNDHYVAERIATFDDLAGQKCSTVELIGVGLDRGLPLQATGVRGRCDINTGVFRGELFTVAIWVVQALVWGLVTLAIAGYTGLVRKVG